MIHQIERKGQDLGSGFFISKDKYEPSLKEKIGRTLQGIKKYNDTQGSDTLTLPYPQEWEQTSYTPKPKTDFIQEQNREKKVGYNLQYHFGGGSGLTLFRSEVNPLEFHTQLPNQIRGDRKPSKGFSKKSRRNVLNKLSCISQDSIPSDKVKLITLTYDGREHYENKYTPKDCKKHLHSFLTRIRQYLQSRGMNRWFYMWRVEPQVKRYLRLGGSPVLHFHLTLFNVSYIDQDWVRTTWSRIVTGWGDCGKEPKELVRTKTETPRSWNNTQQYINKTLCYVSKDTIDDGIYKYIKKKRLNQKESFKRLERLQNMSYGRVWGIGRKDDYKTFIDNKEIKLTHQHTSRLMRQLLKYNKSNLMRSQGEKFNHKRWNQFEKYFRTGKITKKYKTCRVHLYEQQFKEFSTFMRGETTEKLLRLLNIPIIECVKDIRTDVVLDFTPDDYSRRKVVGL